jgi:two-component system phosphate regulon sensor histidine kinase PhoR
MVPQAKRAKLKMIMKELLSPVSIIADSTRLEQVLINLLHNAIKFTPEGGEIEVAIDSLYEDEVVFIVRDSGIGIPREDHSRIFERFFKTDRARTSGGTGLGLAIARHLVEAHGGRIWVESREGFGSQFFVSLPRQS